MVRPPHCIAVLFSLLAACSGGAGSTPQPSAPACKTSADCATGANKMCDETAGACVPPPPAGAIGWHDGSPASVELTLINEDPKTQPTDLAFSAVAPNVLWVVRYKVLSVLVITDPGTDEMDVKTLRDPDAAHFANQTPAIAWGDDNTWATCGDNINPIGENNLFMGPSLFSGDLSIFAKPTPNGLGSHLDMLHSTPLCRGIAHIEKNAYWVFNAYDKSLDRYDFHQDHGPGNDDHSDGEIYRYAAGMVLGQDKTPSQLALSAEDGLLYVADTGNHRIAALDTKSGTLGDDLPRPNEHLVARKFMNDATLTDFVPAGTLEAPSGIELHDGLVYASDNATSTFYAFDKAGHVVRKLNTGLAPGSLAGFTFGPDGKIWFADMKESKIYRIDPK